MKNLAFGRNDLAHAIHGENVISRGELSIEKMNLAVKTAKPSEDTRRARRGTDQSGFAELVRGFQERHIPWTEYTNKPVQISEKPIRRFSPKGS